MGHLLCLGDSITDCGRLFSFFPYGNGYVRFLWEKLAESGEMWTVSNRGFDGFTVRRLLSLIEREGLSSPPDIITILIGVNDLCLMETTCRSQKQQDEMLRQFLLAYEDLLTILTSSCENILLLEPFVFPWPDQYQCWLPRRALLSKGIGKLAAARRLPYLLLQDFWEEQCSLLGAPALTTDGIHLTEIGHRLLADRIFVTVHGLPRKQ